MNTVWWYIIIGFTLLIVNIWPRSRQIVITVTTLLGWVYLDWFHLNDTALLFSKLPLILIFLLAFWWLAKNYLTYPISTFLILLLLSLESSHWLTKSGDFSQSSTSLFLILCTFCWYFLYTLIDCKRSTWQEALKDMGRYLPFWGGTLTPYAKGRRYQDLVSTTTSQQSSRSFLAGIKLISLAWLWLLVRLGLTEAYHYYDVPSLLSTYQSLATGKVVTTSQAWSVLIRVFLDQTLWYAITGHLIIGIVRMAGIHAARNMDKPFISQTIAEFWQRYYFYFKELLVNCFFYPCYFGLPSLKPWLKTIIATIMAAGVGNFLYHLLSSPQQILDHGLSISFYNMQSYAVYCILLSIAISISQWRLMNQAKSRRKKWYSPILVVGFYLLLTPLGQPFIKANLVLNTQFYLVLLGVK